MARGTDALVALEAARIFRFDGAAYSLLARTMDEFDVEDERVAVVRQFVGLSAAELSLIPLLEGDDPLLPVRRPYPVEERHVMLASLKTDSTIDWPCWHGMFEKDAAEPIDVTVFTGDAVKLRELGWEAGIPAPSERVGLIRDLVGRHEKSPISAARRFVERGAVTLQGLIWCTKLAVAAGENPFESVELYTRSFGISAGGPAVSPG